MRACAVSARSTATRSCRRRSRRSGSKNGSTTRRIRRRLRPVSLPKSDVKGDVTQLGRAGAAHGARHRNVAGNVRPDVEQAVRAQLRQLSPLSQRRPSSRAVARGVRSADCRSDGSKAAVTRQRTSKERLHQMLNPAGGVGAISHRARRGSRRTTDSDTLKTNEDGDEGRDRLVRAGRLENRPLTFEKAPQSVMMSSRATTSVVISTSPESAIGKAFRRRRSTLSTSGSENASCALDSFMRARDGRRANPVSSGDRARRERRARLLVDEDERHPDLPRTRRKADLLGGDHGHECPRPVVFLPWHGFASPSGGWRVYPLRQLRPVFVMATEAVATAARQTNAPGATTSPHRPEGRADEIRRRNLDLCHRRPAGSSPSRGRRSRPDNRKCRGPSIWLGISGSARRSTFSIILPTWACQADAIVCGPASADRTRSSFLTSSGKWPSSLTAGVPGSSE